jgi:hypothetical protein
MYSSDLFVPITVLIILGLTFCTGGRSLGYLFNPSFDFPFFSNTERINAEWNEMGFFLVVVIVLGFFFAVGPFFQASVRPAPTFISDVDSSSTPVKVVSHTTAVHHKHQHSSHQHPVHN